MRLDPIDKETAALAQNFTKTPNSKKCDAGIRQRGAAVGNTTGTRIWPKDSRYAS
jgi:hypothetical protein